MPNHIHGIIWMSVGAAPRGRPNRRIDQPQGQDHPIQEPSVIPLGQARGPAPTVFDIVYWFKSMTTTRYRYGVEQSGCQPFQKKLWQRNYYERIIRNDDELNRIRQYIRDNPNNWDQDPENQRL